MKNIILSIFSAIFLSACSTPQDTIQDFTMPVSEKTIVAFGDSLTAGLGLKIEDSYPSLLQEKLKKEAYKDYTVINAGLSGETTAGAVRRLDWTMKLNPDIVIIESGGNDALRGTSVEEIEKNLSTILSFFQEKKVKILFVGIEAPENQGSEYKEQFNAIYPQLAEKYKVAFMPFFWEGLVGKQDLLQSDGIHPTKAGYNIIVENLFQYLKPLLDN